MLEGCGVPVDYVVKITGKLFTCENTSLIRRYVDVLKSVARDGYRLVVVTGGGPVARDYIGFARSAGVESNYWLDRIAIGVSRLNALLMAAALQPYSYPRPVESLDELLAVVEKHSIVVLGGLIPGQSTATVAAEVAEALGVDTIVNAGAVDYVYTKDPVKHPDAKPLEKVSLDEITRYIETRSLPGQYQLLDHHAIEIMKRSRIKMILTHYKKPENIEKIIRQKQITGTIITP